MRTINLFGHPLLLIAIFLFFIVEGAHYGGFYVRYLQLALPYGSAYALLAVVGIAAVIAGFIINRQPLRQLLDLTGIVCMVISLVIFFNTHPVTGVDATFRDTVPLLSFIVLSVVTVCFTARALMTLQHWRNRPGLNQ